MIYLKKNNILFIFLILLSNFSFLLYINEPFVDEVLIEKEKIKYSSVSDGGYLMDTEAIYSWIEINETGTILEQISDTTFDYQSLQFPMNFRLYKTNYDRCVIVSSGYLVFPSSNVYSRTGHIPFKNLHNYHIISLFGDYLITSESYGGGGAVYYEFLTSPNRLVIEYKDVYTYNDTGPSYVGSFELILFSQSGDIKFQYKDVLSIYNNQAIVGLDRGDGLNFNYYSEFNQNNLPITEKAIHFTFNKILGVCGNEERGGSDEFPGIPGINPIHLLLILSIMILGVIYIVVKNNLHKYF